MDNVIDVQNMAAYYGDIDMPTLQEVILIFPETTHFEFEGKQYGTTPQELTRVVEDWQNYLRARGFEI